MEAGLKPAGPGMRYESWGPHVFKTNVEGGVASRMKMPQVMDTTIGGKMAYLTPGIGLAVSAYTVYSGYREGGMSGAIQGVILMWQLWLLPMQCSFQKSCHQ